MATNEQCDTPWLRNKRWANGKIVSSAKASVLVPVAFASFWNLFLAWPWFAFFNKAVGEEKRFLLLWLIPFTVVGVGLACWAIAAVLRWCKYGRSVFEMASVPGVIGGQLAGVIRTSTKIRPEDGFHITLSCVHCVTPRGRDSSIMRNILWQDEQFVTHELLQNDFGRSAIPVLFQIPYDCRPTDERDARNLTFWSLEITAKTPGLDYRATFNVPVFKTSESDPNFVVDRSLIAAYAAPEDPVRDLREAGVIKTASPTGDGCQFVFPMARDPRSAVLVTLMAIFGLGVPFVVSYLGEGWLLLIVCGGIFGLSGVLLLLSALHLWFYRSVIDVSPRGLTVTGGLFGRGSSQSIEAAEAAKIEAVRNMNSREGSVYYDLVIVCRSGKRVTAGKRLPGKRLATAVIGQIEQALGKQQTQDVRK